MENTVYVLLKLHAHYLRYAVFHLRYYQLEEAPFSLALRKERTEIIPKVWILIKDRGLKQEQPWSRGK